MKLMIIIIQGFWTIFFIFIVIFTFWLMCPLAFFRCFFLNSGVYTEFQTMSFILYMGVICSGSINHNRVQVLSIPVLLLACSQLQSHIFDIITNMKSELILIVSTEISLIHI